MSPACYRSAPSRSVGACAWGPIVSFSVSVVSTLLHLGAPGLVFPHSSEQSQIATSLRSLVALLAHTPLVTPRVCSHPRFEGFHSSLVYGYWGQRVRCLIACSCGSTRNPAKLLATSPREAFHGKSLWSSQRTSAYRWEEEGCLLFQAEASSNLPPLRLRRQQGEQ